MNGPTTVTFTGPAFMPNIRNKRLLMGRMSNTRRTNRIVRCAIGIGGRCARRRLCLRTLFRECLHCAWISRVWIRAIPVLGLPTPTVEGDRLRRADSFASHPFNSLL